MAALALPFRYALAANSTSADFTAQNATATEPTGVGVIDLMSEELGVGEGDHHVPAYLQLVPFGTDAADETFDMRVYGFTPTVPTDLVTDTAIYIPQLLLDMTVTLSAITFSGHAANTFLADTFVINDGAGAETNIWQNAINPAEDLVGSIILHTRGCRYIKFDWDLGTAATANCLWRPVEF